MFFQDDFVEFENDQANQNCHGKNFYSKEDATELQTSYQAVAEGTSDILATPNVNTELCADEELALLPSQSPSLDNNAEQSSGITSCDKLGKNDHDTVCGL